MAATQASGIEAASECLVKTIDASPREGQNISHDGNEYTTIREGLAHILVPHGIPTSTDPKISREDAQKQQVFYNPIQQFNRDLSVLAIKTFGNDLVERRQEKREQQRKKGARKADRQKRQIQNGVGEGQEDKQELEGSPAKKRKTCEPDGAVSSVLVGNGAGGEQEEGEPSWRPPFTILDALSATGLRALRYAKEIPFATSIVANDMSSKATDSILLNVKHNRVEDRVKASTGNAIAHMYSFVEKKGYDVIDLDPYGTAAPFIDAAIQAINDDGLLCVTCTDSAIFASHGYLEKTYSQYGGLPLKGEPCHEGGLRLILHAIASSAARYGMAMEPLLSLSIDYYIRVFVRIRKSPNDVKLLAGKTMIVYHCQSGCGSWSTQFLARNKSKQNRDGTPSFNHSFSQGPSADKHCQHCGFKTHLSGPMYGGPLHNVGFIERILAQIGEIDRETYPTMDRIKGMLHTALEEITFGSGKKETEKQLSPKQLDHLIPKSDPSEIDGNAFFFIPSAVSKVIHCQAPPVAALRGALRHAGFRVTMSHCKPGSIRTDASWTAIWHIILEWVRQKAPLQKQLKEGTAGYGIITKGSAHKADYESTEKAEAVIVENLVDVDPQEAPSSTVQEGSNRLHETGSVTPAYLDANFKVVFDEALGRDHDRGKYVRYQLAPRENWGPMSRAK